MNIIFLEEGTSILLFTTANLQARKYDIWTADC